MKWPKKFLEAEPNNQPKTREKIQALPKGGVLAGWYKIVRANRPIEIGIPHYLDTEFYTIDYWFWAGSNDAFNLNRWSAKKPHPDDAGPVKVLGTRNFLYFYFEPDKPIYAHYDSAQNRFDMLNEGHIAALIIPVKLRD